MIELSLPLIAFCIAPKTLSFVKDIKILEFISYPFNFKGDMKFQLLDVKLAKKSYLKKCVVRAGFSWSSPFHEDVPVKYSLGFFNTRLTIEAFLSFFSIDYSNMEKPWKEIEESIKSILLLSPLFLKQGEIWCVFIQDNILSAENIKKIGILFSSKVENSNAIILYSTASGKSLSFKEESLSI